MNQERDETMMNSFGWGRLGLVALAIGLTMGGFISTVNAEGGNVRYSYEEVRIGGDREFVLVPRAEANLRGEVTRDTLEQAFEALRRAKRPTYGNSYAAVTGDAPYDARVEVNIDSNHTDFAPIIMAEAVYTLTEFGVSEVHFPGHTSGGLTRADISFPAYTLTVPLWKVVPTGKVTTAQVLMPDGELKPIQEINEMWAEDEEALVDRVYEFIGSEDAYTVRSVARALPEIADLRLSEITPLLAHDDRAVRRQALRILDGLENNDVVLQAVSTALEEESSRGLARQMAEFLGESSNREFNVEMQLFLIAQGDDEEAVEATTGIHEWDDDSRVVEVLAELLRDERNEVAEAAVESLKKMAVHSERSAALEDDDVSAEIRQRISEDLVDDANPAQVRLIGLTYIAEERSGGYANQAIAQIAELPIDTARVQVEKFLSDSSVDKRRAAAEALKSRSDVESVEALMAADSGYEGELMSDIAYEIMVAQQLEEIMEQTRADAASVQMVAYQAIGERASRDGVRGEAVEIIEEGIGHNQANIRGAAARSLGQIGGDDALDTLGRMLGDNSPVVRRAVALALGQFSTTQHAQALVEYLEDDDPGVIAAAIDAMEQRGDERAAEQIRDMVRSEHPQIRASALRAVTTFLPEGDDPMRRHLGMLSGAVTDDDIEVRLSALEQLGRFDSSMAVTNIAILVGAEETRVRAAAVRALGDTGHNDARPPLTRALNDEEATVRREAIEALTGLGGSEARTQLEGRMEEEEDPEIQELLQNRLEQI